LAPTRLGRLFLDDLALSGILALLLPSGWQQLRATPSHSCKFIMIWEFCEICRLGSIKQNFNYEANTYDNRLVVCKQNGTGLKNYKSFWLLLFWWRQEALCF
jgi:hypothetical protein